MPGRGSVRVPTEQGVLVVNPIQRYESYTIRRVTPRLGPERAAREGPALARFRLAVFVWVIPIVLATLVSNPANRLAIYAVAICWLPVVLVTGRTYFGSPAPSAS